LIKVGDIMILAGDILPFALPEKMDLQISIDDYWG
jgi:hypothetical protein